jgi:5-(carboxyamino)imidazole ribonucleotide mutase
VKARAHEAALRRCQNLGTAIRLKLGIGPAHGSRSPDPVMQRSKKERTFALLMLPAGAVNSSPFGPRPRSDLMDPNWLIFEAQIGRSRARSRDFTAPVTALPVFSPLRGRKKPGRLMAPTGQLVCYRHLATLKVAPIIARFPSGVRGGPMPGKPVAIIMGSQSDWQTMKHAADTLDALGIGYVAKIMSAHRTPERHSAFTKGAKAQGFKVIIAGAGGAAHLPGVTAALTALPVLGVPIESQALSGVDSLYSIVQMPPGVPVGTLAIGRPGAINAALFAASVLALADEEVAKRLDLWRQRQTEAVPETPDQGKA